MMVEWQSQFGKKANFLIIYIAEAHASDVWPLGKHVCIPDHKTLKDRQVAATLMRDMFKCPLPMLIDSMSNQFDNAFAVWPERYFIIQDYKMKLIASPNKETGYDRKEISYHLVDLQ